MPEIVINVAEKIAVSEPCCIVCNNSDYEARFVLDSEWSDYSVKTACFTYEGRDGRRTEEVVFSGDTCRVPCMYNTSYVEVGVYAGDIHTTSPCLIPCVKSIMCRAGETIPAPTAEEYQQLLNALNTFVSIAGIERTSGDGTAGSTDVYTITYSDESTETFSIYNAEDPTYIYVKYSAAEPASDADMKDEADTWIGIYTGTSSTAPTAYTDYTWHALATCETATAAEVEAVCV